MNLRILYFAAVRERIGLAEERLEPPASVATVADLMGWLVTRDDAHADAFAEPAAICSAIDRVHARPEAPLAGAREVAFFPPMTGG